MPNQKPILFVEDSPCFIKPELSEKQLKEIIKIEKQLTEAQIRELIRRNINATDVVKFIPNTGLLELYTIEAESKLEFKRRGYKLL